MYSTGNIWTKLVNAIVRLSFIFYYCIRHPYIAARAVWRASEYDLQDSLVEPSLLSESKKKIPVLKLKLYHIAYFSKRGNAGDVLLPVTIQDLFRNLGIDNFINEHVHKEVSDIAIKKINQTSGILVGGGGLFLRDTNPNLISGWQWPCSADLYKEIQVPLALFAVGYNRFRNQADFGDTFQENLHALAEKCVYLGLRNSGSVKSIKSYLPDSLQSKVRFQPCLTTVLRKLYPERFQNKKSPSQKIKIGINCAFDRAELRFGTKEIRVLECIARSLSHWKKDAEFFFLQHLEADQQFLPFLRGFGVEHEVVALNRMSSAQILNAYSCLDVVYAMRGHAQLIPFGCGVPTISLISHDKLAWFLEDLNHSEWGVDLNEGEDLDEKLHNLGNWMIENGESVKKDILIAQEILWDVTLQNACEFLQCCGFSNLSKDYLSRDEVPQGKLQSRKIST